MTTFTRSAPQNNFTPNPLVGQLVNSVYGVFPVPPLIFKGVNNGQRDVIPQYPSITVWNGESGFIESYLYDRWAQHVLFSPIPNYGDALIYNNVLGIWIPTPTGTPTLASANIYNDSTSALQVKRFYKSLTPVLTTTTGTLVNTGAHTLTGSTDKNYRIQIDSTSTDWRVATFKWSSDGGATYTAQNVPLVTGATGGRQVLAPLTLDNGVSIIFSEGQYTNADYWTFTAIASGNQLYDLAVDTTNHVVKVGTTLEIANDPYFYLAKASANPRIVFDSILPIPQILYSRAYTSLLLSNNLSSIQIGLSNLSWGTNGDILLAADAGAFVYIGDGSNNIFPIGTGLNLKGFRGTPATPAAYNGRIYLDTVGAVQHPFYIDEAGATYDLATPSGFSGFAVPSLTLGTANAAGAATTAIRTDATILAFDATVPTSSAEGDAAAVGAATVAARRDHKHGREAFATPAIVLGNTAAAGAATTVIRSDATIAAFDGTAPLSTGPSNVIGTAAKAARRDHIHSGGIGTRGDLLTVNNANAYVALTLGTAGQNVTSNGSDPIWADNLVGSYGDGSDGALTVNTATTLTLTRTMYYTTITLTDSTSVINTAGYGLFCSGTITLNGGTIHNNGTVGTGGSNSTSTAGGAGGTPGGTAGTVNDFGSSLAAAGTSGGAGGNPTVAGIAGGNSLSGPTGDGGSGGTGGTGANGAGVGAGAGAAGGTPIAVVARHMRCLSLHDVAIGKNQIAGGSSGTGGGGGGGGALTLGGGGGGGAGGGGGGVVFIAARSIDITTGTISAKGGAGGNGGSGATGGVDGGGGGGGAGGGGGFVYLVYGSIVTGGTITAAGGAKGTKGASGANCAAANDGANGTAGYWVTVNLGTGVITTTNS